MMALSGGQACSRAHLPRRATLRAHAPRAAAAALSSEARPARARAVACLTVEGQAAAALEAAAAQAVQHGSFVLPAPAFAALSRSTGLGDEELLTALAWAARAAASPPISDFRVGAAALGASGAAYLGVNLEWRGLPLNAAVHAEQCAVTLARRARESGVSHLATTAVPCGHCRQWLYELPRAERLVVLGGTGGPRPLAALLPDAFGPDALLPGGGRRLLGAVHNGLQLDAAARDWLAARRAAPGPDAAALLEAAYAALSGANAAHAPYSGCAAGLALVGPGGRVAAGGCGESAAFNPTISPLQAALIAAFADGGGAAPAPSACVLVEARGGAVSYAAVTRALLGRIAPGCELTVLHCEDFRTSRLAQS